MKLFLIHGAYGNPQENWFPWLKKELAALGYEVIAPSFPTPKNQSLENWMNVMKLHLKDIDEETIFVAHSIAPAFVLSVLEKINVKTKACFFVSGFIEKLDNEKFGIINKTFTGKEFDLEKIKQNCKEFIVYASDNDPYVPLIKTARLAKSIGGQLTIIPGAGHFNEKSGFTKFLKLRDDILELR